MKIIIDAYNLLKSIAPTQQLIEEQEHYITMIQHYAQKKHHDIMLIFDSGFWHYEYQEKQGYVIRHFAGKGKSADDVIKRILPSYASYETLLITFDKELVSCAARFSIPTLGPTKFFSYVVSAIAPQDKPITKESKEIKKTNKEKNEYVDALMLADQKALMNKPDEDDSVIQHEPKRSKKESQFQKLLNKL
jgi:predicted RNA-binding protein with PIN domain